MANVKISDLIAASTVSDAEIVPIVQSSTTKKSAWSVIKTYLRTAFDAVYVPLTRNITINGTTQDLSADQTWTVVTQSGAGVSQLLSGGGVAWTGTSLNYIVSSATYIINGVQYSSAQTNVTLSPADATQDRIDVFYVTTSGTVGHVTGTPGTPPLQPSIDPGTQLELTFAYIVAAASVPSVTNVDIYLENTEYTSSTNSAGTINLASTNNPFAGTKDIEGTATANGNLFTLVKPSGTLDLSAYTQLALQLRSKAAWASAKSISIFWMNGTTTVVGVSVAVKDGTFGFNSSNVSSYQQIVIPITSFGTGSNLVDRLRCQVSGGGSSIGWYIDNIILQAGGGGGGGGGTLTSFSSGNLSPLFTSSVTNPTSTPALSFSLNTAAAQTVFGNATGSTAAPAFSSAPQFLKIGNLTSNGFVKTGSGDGTLSVDTSTYLSSTNISDTAYASSWNGVTTNAPSKNAVYDFLHLFADDTTGKVSLLNQSAGITNTNSSGVLQSALTAPAGTIVGTSDTQTFTNKRNTPRITTITSSATPTINTDNCDCVTITALAAAITSMTSNLSGTPNNFDKLIFRIKDDGTARAITWGASFEAVGVALPTTTVISKRLVVGFIYDTVTSKWGCVASVQEA